MKKVLIALSVIAATVYVFSCKKSDLGTSVNCTNVSAASDSTYLLAFAKQYGITTSVDANWIYYQIIDSGKGAAVQSNSKVYVRYAARLMNGNYFDSSAVRVRFALDSLILGWQYGIPKIKSGGQIKLLVPSALGYGCYGAGYTVPPNAPLYFNVFLDSVSAQ